jgi:hypothetical protein
LFEIGTLSRALRNVLAGRLARHFPKIGDPYALATFMIEDGVRPKKPYTLQEKRELGAATNWDIDERGQSEEDFFFSKLFDAKRYDAFRWLKEAKRRISSRKYDVWNDPKHTRTFTATVKILYLTRKQIDEAYARGEIGESDYNEYWKKTKSEHLEEIAVYVPSGEIRADVKRWVETWKHKGGSWYLPDKEGYAVRCGGKNQSRDPVNIFFLF